LKNNPAPTYDTKSSLLGPWSQLLHHDQLLAGPVEGDDEDTEK